MLDDIARRRTAGKSLAQVWERQRELKLLATRVSGALDVEVAVNAYWYIEAFCLMSVLLSCLDAALY
jgi:hypothetical protein